MREGKRDDQIKTDNQERIVCILAVVVIQSNNQAREEVLEPELFSSSTIMSTWRLEDTFRCAKCTDTVTRWRKHSLRNVLGENERQGIHTVSNTLVSDVSSSNSKGKRHSPQTSTRVHERIEEIQHAIPRYQPTENLIMRSLIARSCALVSLAIAAAASSGLHARDGAFVYVAMMRSH